MPKGEFYSEDIEEPFLVPKITFFIEHLKEPFFLSY